MASFFLFLTLGGVIFFIFKTVDIPKLTFPDLKAVSSRAFGGLGNQSRPLFPERSSLTDVSLGDSSKESREELKTEITPISGQKIPERSTQRGNPFRTEITITSADVNTFVNSLPKDKSPLNDFVITLDSGTITTTGKLAGQLGGDIKLILKPTATAVGDVSIETTEATLNGIVVPGFLLPNFENILGNLISDKLKQYVTYKVSGVSVSNGELIIVGEFGSTQ